MNATSGPVDVPPAFAPTRWGTVSRLPAPGRDPRLCEEVPLASIQGTLAIDLADRPAAEPPDLTLVTSARVEDAGDVGAWAARFAQAVVEVAGGDRPVGQLLRLTSTSVYTDLTRRVRILARTSPVGQRRRTVRPQVRSVRVCRPTATSAEVSVHVRHGHRSRALAARLEVHDGRWVCTALQIG